MAPRKRQEPAPDLHSQLESLLDAVWRNEKEQDMQGRIDRAAAVAEREEKKKLADKVMVEPKPDVPKAKKKPKDEEDDGKPAPDNPS